MKVVFLDIDGVLNGFDVWPPDANRLWINPESVALLNELTDRTGARIVVTSTWRLSKKFDVMDLLRAAGVTGDLVGQTTNLYSSTRGQEIQYWMNAVQYIQSFVILDDDADMGKLKNSLVRTKWHRGLERQHIEQAIAILGVTM